MEINFKFEIGDIVRHVISAKQKASYDENSWHPEIRMIVLRRHFSDTGPSQVDIQYDCRPVEYNGSVHKLISFDEIELVASEPFSDSPCEPTAK